MVRPLTPITPVLSQCQQVEIGIDPDTEKVLIISTNQVTRMIAALPLLQARMIQQQIAEAIIGLEQKDADGAYTKTDLAEQARVGTDDTNKMVAVVLIMSDESQKIALLDPDQAMQFAGNMEAAAEELTRNPS